MDIIKLHSLLRFCIQYSPSYSVKENNCEMFGGYHLQPQQLLVTRTRGTASDLP